MSGLSDTLLQSEQNTSLVSVIIPVHNRIDLIPLTLQSVFDQSYTNWEIILVDDGSTDGSYELIQEIALSEKRLVVIKNTSGVKGASAARNAGIVVSKGAYILFLDSDDLLKPFCIEKRVFQMQLDKELDFSVYMQDMFETDPKKIKAVFNLIPGKHDSYLNMFIRNDNPWQTMAVLWKKATLLKLSGFDPDFLVMEDPELHTRALLDPFFKYKVFNELPPDCLYRIGNMDGDKSETFYQHSIIYRFIFLKKIFSLIQCCSLSLFEKKQALHHWKLGVFNLFKNFLVSRLKKYQRETLEFLDWAEENGALGKSEMRKLNLAVKVWTSDSVLLNKVRIKGILNRILFKQAR